MFTSLIKTILALLNAYYYNLWDFAFHFHKNQRDDISTRVIIMFWASDTTPPSFKLSRVCTTKARFTDENEIAKLRNKFLQIIQTCAP